MNRPRDLYLIAVDEGATSTAPQALAVRRRALWKKQLTSNCSSRM